VREVLENLVASYPSLRNRIFEGDELPQFLNVFIDGTDVRLNEGLETPVNAGATVILLPAVAGGQSIRFSIETHSSVTPSGIVTSSSSSGSKP
jgi:molybdopterin converting factor small subunit